MERITDRWNKIDAYAHGHETVFNGIDPLEGFRGVPEARYREYWAGFGEALMIARTPGRGKGRRN